jgi:xanthine permease XanP
VDAVRDNEASDVVEIGISVFTYLVIVCSVVWGSLRVRNFAPILGIAAGSVLSALLVTIPSSDSSFVRSSPAFGAPGLPDVSLDFEFGLAIPFIVLGLAAGLRTIGVIMTLHDAANPDEGPTDRPEVKHAVRNDGAGAATAGLVGFVGVSSAPSAIGVSVSSGIMSRVVAVTLAAMLVVLAFSPRALSYLVTAPATVVSALLIYYASYMFIGGLRLIVRQHLDLRTTFIVGTSMSVALGARFYSASTETGSDWVALTASSMLAMGVLTAVILNLIFRIGLPRQSAFVIQVEDDGPGGNPLGVISTDLRSAFAEVDIDDPRTAEAVRLGAMVAREIVDQGLAAGEISARVSTDDVQMRVELVYDGEPLVLTPHRLSGPDRFADENVFVAGLDRFFDVAPPDDVTVRTRGSRVTMAFVYDVV